MSGPTPRGSKPGEGELKSIRRSDFLASFRDAGTTSVGQRTRRMAQRTVERIVEGVLLSRTDIQHSFPRLPLTPNRYRKEAKFERDPGHGMYACGRSRVQDFQSSRCPQSQSEALVVIDSRENVSGPGLRPDSPGKDLVS